jgi:hypothetical protein
MFRYRSIGVIRGTVVFGSTPPRDRPWRRR